MTGPGGHKAHQRQGPVAEFAPSEAIRLAGGSESGLFSALSCELSEYASIELCAAERMIDSAAAPPQDRCADPLALVACAVKAAAGDPWLVERLRVALSVARHFEKESALCLGSRAGCEAVALAGLGLRVTLADWPGPLRDFAIWRLSERGHQPVLATPSELPDSRFDVIYCSIFGAESLDKVRLVADLFCRMSRDAILYLAPESPIHAWGQKLLAALSPRGLRPAWDCGHLLVYCSDAPVYSEVPMATQVAETASALRRLDAA